MNDNRRNKKTGFRAVEEFIWNIIGGSLVAAMLAGVIFALTGTIASEIYSNDSYWDLKYFYRFFFGTLLFYLVLPRVFTSVLGFLIGSSAGGRKRSY